MQTHFMTAVARGVPHGMGRSNTGRSTPVSSQSQVLLPHKVRGPNWTEVKMFVLIGQKRIEWDRRHNCINILWQSLCTVPLQGNWSLQVAWLWLVPGKGRRSNHQQVGWVNQGLQKTEGLH